MWMEFVIFRPWAKQDLFMHRAKGTRVMRILSHVIMECLCWRVTNKSVILGNSCKWGLRGERKHCVSLQLWYLFCETIIYLIMTYTKATDLKEVVFNCCEKVPWIWNIHKSFLNLYKIFFYDSELYLNKVKKFQETFSAHIRYFKHFLKNYIHGVCIMSPAKASLAGRSDVVIISYLVDGYIVKIVRCCQRQYSTVYGRQLNIPVSVCRHK